MGRTLFISVDAEGMPYASSRLMMSPKDPLYKELREIMTTVTLWTAEEFNKLGFSRVVVADSHGQMVNIDPLRLPGYVDLVRGFPRSLMMITGSEGASAAVFLGYHTSPRLGGVLAHTYAGRIVQRVDVYGQNDATEYLLNTYALGERGVPVIMVAGDEGLRERVEKHTPWAVFLPLKRAASSLSDISPGWPRIKGMIQEAARKAEEVLRSGKARPKPPAEPWIRVELKRPWYADVAELFPCVRRLDGLTLELTCSSFTENLRLLEGIVIAAYSIG